MKLVYKRVVLKISGQRLAGDDGFGISTQAIQRTAQEIVEVREQGVEVPLAIEPRGHLVFVSMDQMG